MWPVLFPGAVVHWLGFWLLCPLWLYWFSCFLVFRSMGWGGGVFVHLFFVVCYCFLPYSAVSGNPFPPSSKYRQYVVSVLFLMIGLLFLSCFDRVYLGLLFVQVSKSHSDTTRSVGFIWMGDWPVADTSTWIHIPFTRDRHPSPQRDSIRKPKQASDRRTTP